MSDTKYHESHYATIFSVFQEVLKCKKKIFTTNYFFSTLRHCLMPLWLKMNAASKATSQDLLIVTFKVAFLFRKNT